MNKDYLPYYNSLNDKDKEFWLSCTKEELIDHLIGAIRNGETLLNRITNTIEYIDKLGYQDIIDNPRKELVKVLTGDKHD